MPATGSQVTIRPLDELDLDGIVRIDEAIGGQYRPEVWERRVMVYLRRDPGASQVAEAGGRIVGFMLGDCRTGEFGIEEPTGWIERFGIHPDHRGHDLGRRMFEAMCAHFRAEGASRVRTMVAREDAALVGFLGALGFGESPLTALERGL